MIMDESEHSASPSVLLRRRRRRNKAVEGTLTESQKEQARRAVLWAAERRWKSAIPASPSSSLDHQSRPFLETPSVNSLDSVSTRSPLNDIPEKPPSERAVLRGSRRGMRERNEGDGADAGRRTPSLTNTTKSQSTHHTQLAGTAKTKSGRRGASSLFRSKKKLSQDPVDAWMCGVCGKAFTTYEAAETHEDAHISQIISHLPWLPSSPANSTRNNPQNLISILRQSPSPQNNKNHVLPEFGEHKNDNNKDPRQLTPVASNRTGRSRSRSLSFAQHDEEAKIPEDGAECDDNFSMEPPIVRTPPRRRSISYGSTVPLRIDPLLGQPEPHEALLLSRTLQESAILADEAVVQVCEKAAPHIISDAEKDAEWALACLARDKEYYDHMAERELARRTKPSNKYRSSEKDLIARVQNKFVDAYQLMKEGKDKKGFKDEYRLGQKEGDNQARVIQHNNKTLYLNVMVKNNIQVVRRELERLAQQRWESGGEMGQSAKRFERFRAMAQVNMVRIAGLALETNFTPRRVAVQLSNDLYRLLTPRLRRRGVTIETGIEYRVGPYFVIAINITQIDWHRLIKYTYREVAQRKQKWKDAEADAIHEPSDNDEKQTKKNFPKQIFEFYLVRLCTACYMKFFNSTQYDLVAQLLAWCFHLHWVVYQPLCLALYYTIVGHSIRQFILSSAADEIFFYIEQKGMEMEMEIRLASTQAAFMLSALREIRADGQELKKKREQTDSEDKGDLLGPLLGPAIKADKESVDIPEGFEPPENLEYIGLELDLPVGFRRLRWAFLHKDSQFITEAVYRTEAKYDNITMGEWNKHADLIGAPNLPAGVDESEFVGAEKEASYLMPRSAFTKANMCSETHYILAYNDYCFCLRKRALTPDVPYGSTFVAWTQFLVLNNGNDSCKLYCSVEPEFPNGPPFVSRQIKSGMRAGVSELFVLVGQTIAKYADEYP